MDAEPAALTVVYARAALRELDQIWEWNAAHRGAEHATRYIETLRKRIEGLGADPNAGKVVKADPNFRYLVMWKRPKADGHVAGYRIDQATQTIRILHVFHTKQDWQTALEGDEP